jgi:glycerophosphoryl diester phosphodiesterase
MSTIAESNTAKACFRQPFYAKDGKTRLPQYVAHRGFNKIYPENTLSAFQAAIDVGCHGIETDVQISRDGVVVISHVFPLLLLSKCKTLNNNHRILRSPDALGLIRKSTNAIGSI